MRVSLSARALFAGTVAAGVVLLTFATVRSVDVPVATLALFGAAVILTELAHVSGPRHPSSTETASFSFSTGVHVAASLVLGPSPAALIAAFGVLAVDSLRGASYRQLAYNASVFGIASAMGGWAFIAAGGTPGDVSLPDDLGAIAALTVVMYATNNVLIEGIIALSSPGHGPTLEQLRTELPPILGEVCFGVAFALFVISEPWALLTLLPLALAVYQAHSRLVSLQEQTGRALEAFANVIDERDTYTARHSERVARHAAALARVFGLSESEVARVWRAGRLHDLGKIAVDASILNKPTKLDEEEWTSMRRHPRLSARLLNEFSFASSEAQAVEYHHERFDGRGYYAMDPDEIPLTSHFLVIADSYDAMTSDRPYRPALPREVALAEIERNRGTQFHPVIAKAFVAMERGEHPSSVLSPEEIAEVRALRSRKRVSALRLVKTATASAGLLPVGSGVVALLALVAGLPLLTAASGGIALIFVLLDQVERARAARVARVLRAALARARTSDELERLLDELLSPLSAASRVAWGGVFGWQEAELSGTLVAEWNRGRGPSSRSLTSWLLREANAGDGVAVAAQGAVDGRSYVALALRDDDALVGYLVLGFDRALSRQLVAAFDDVHEALSEVLTFPLRHTRPPSGFAAAAA